MALILIISIHIILIMKYCQKLCILWRFTNQFQHYYTGWPRKNATLTINNFKKTRDRMEKLCALLHIKNIPSKMTPRSLILMKVFWFYGRFSEAMSFSRFALLSQNSQFTFRKFSIVWLPWVKCLLLLCKAKPAWIKRSIHYVTLQHYNLGELLREIPPYLKRDFWYKKEQILKMTLPPKNGPRINTPLSKSLILVSFCWEKNVLLLNALTNLI